MPGLGFLKKKRTREGQSDNTAATSSSHHKQQPSVGASSGAAALPSGGGGQTTAAVGGAAAGAPRPPQHQPQGQSNPHAPAAALNQPHLQQPPAPAPPSGAGTTTANPPHDPQNPNAPIITNLANAPQNDGVAHANSSSQTNLIASPFNHSASSLGPPIVPTTSASPGTDPALQQQQAVATAANTAAMQTDQPVQPQQQQQSGHQPQASQSSTARVTKGKYTLTDFDILRTLGTGSFGRVHLVQSKHNQRFYAIKVLKKAQIVKMKQVEHTNDERRMLSDVKHPFLITLWGTFQDWKNLYMVMDFVEGGELFSLLRKSGRFPNPVAKFYAAEATLALEYMHSKNIIYRDLKPENLLLDRHGHLKITDFGFAKRVPDKTWTLCGTPDYLAPEVVSNKGYNKSVDWWSLGILIYEMLCGYTPFWDSGSPMRIYENILKGKVKYPAYIVPEAQDLLQKLITADLTKRLGNLYGGSTDVKNHPWFHEVTWDRLARKDIDAPYTPPVKAGAGDASQFDKYPEEQDKYGQGGGADDFGHLFTEF